LSSKRLRPLYFTGAPQLSRLWDRRWRTVFRAP